MKQQLSKVIFFLVILLALLGIINSPVALILGFAFASTFENPYQKATQKGISYLLKIAVVGLGFGMELFETIKTSKEGFTLTFLSIVLTITLGMILIKLLKIERKLGHLISSGTAICGGSAIAAVAPVIKADAKTISIALGVVFFLNSVALFIFPHLGHFFEMTQNQFGLWSAIAIHDTSSVVGAALEYGDEALKTATTVKLARTLWIIPLSIFSMLLFKVKGEKIKIPYFILIFIAVIILNSFIHLPTFITENIVMISKRLLVLTLFLVGTTISFKDLKSIGIKPILFAIILWVSISIFSLVYILA
ncbi:MAG: putative sulfate exporter family transporter [Crocinitomicaceae bacterium]|nr:putative sulfate exporter family transporter [Crocinitomicaceae bacterium]